jgi:hypothetical protein
MFPQPNCIPPQQAVMELVLVRTAGGEALQHFGNSQSEGFLGAHFRWTDGTPLLQSSTVQLRLLQISQRSFIHNSLSKWEARLRTPAPETIWTTTWLTFTAEKENVFLWQLIYHSGQRRRMYSCGNSSTGR